MKRVIVWLSMLALIASALPLSQVRAEETEAAEETAAEVIDEEEAAVSALPEPGDVVNGFKALEIREFPPWP